MINGERDFVVKIRKCSAKPRSANTLFTAWRFRHQGDVNATQQVAIGTGEMKASAGVLSVSITAIFVLWTGIMRTEGSGEGIIMHMSRVCVMGKVTPSGFGASPSQASAISVFLGSSRSTAARHSHFLIQNSEIPFVIYIFRSRYD